MESRFTLAEFQPVLTRPAAGVRFSRAGQRPPRPAHPPARRALPSVAPGGGREAGAAALGRPRADPGAEPPARVPGRGARRALHRREPGQGDAAADPGLARLVLRDRLHALLCDDLRLHRALGGDRLPRRAVQHRRRGAGGARRDRGDAGVPRRAVAALGAGAAVRHPRRRAVRRGLGVRPRLPAGEAREPHRHHHDHVQLHRRGAGRLPARQRDEGARVDGAGDRELPRGDAAAVHARDARRGRHSACRARR